MTKKKPLPPGNAKCLLLPSANKENKPAQEVNLNGNVYWKFNMASMIYSILSCHTGNKSSLVDQDTNGGIAGDNIQVIAKTGRSIDIQDIDNHRINKIP